jgi:hypothetical protein
MARIAHRYGAIRHWRVDVIENSCGGFSPFRAEPFRWGSRRQSANRMRHWQTVREHLPRRCRHVRLRAVEKVADNPTSRSDRPKFFREAPSHWRQPVAFEKRLIQNLCKHRATDSASIDIQGRLSGRREVEAGQDKVGIRSANTSEPCPKATIFNSAGIVH